MTTITSTPTNTAIYVHWPFCESKCPYCDFNSHVRDTIDIARWQAAFDKTIRNYHEYLADKTISSIFFGGGTPTLMPPSLAGYIIDQLRQVSTFANDIEITIEGNPSSTEMDNLKHFASEGVNRVSLGIQSLHQHDLEFLGRRHNAKEAIAAIDMVRDVFDNYNFDLIYARPNQTLKAWEKELSTALSYTGRHLSLYQLTIEKGTPFYSAHQRNEFVLPDEETSARLYELTSDITSDFGLVQYEVSNYASPGYECKHNLTYWKYGDYLGIGPGAHSRITGTSGHKHAQMETHLPEKWLELTLSEGNNSLQQKEVISATEQAIESVIMGLRLTEGILLPKNNGIINKESLANLSGLGFVSVKGDTIRITEKGRLLTNQIIAQLINS